MERFYKIDLILRVITIIQNVEQCVCVNRISGLIVVMLNSMHHSYLSSFLLKFLDNLFPAVQNA